MAILQMIQSYQLCRRQSMEEGGVVQIFTNSKAASTPQSSSKNSRPAFACMHARCTLKTLKRRQAVTDSTSTTTVKAMERPSSRLRGTERRRGLKVTLKSHTFFMRRSVQVSSSARTVDCTASRSNWCCVTSSLYLSAALSEAGSSCLGRARRSIFFLMSRTVNIVVTTAKVANHTSTMARWQFCSVLLAIKFKQDYKGRDCKKKGGVCMVPKGYEWMHKGCGNMRMQSIRVVVG